MKTKHAVLAGAAALSLVSFTSIVLAGPDNPQDQTTLVEIVRRVTAPFHNVAAATAAGYASARACVSGPEEGAMGIHFVTGDLVGDGQLDAERPEMVIYEATKGRLRLLGVEYIVFAEDWHATNEAPPVLVGQHFHYVGSPNRYGLPAFYELHVWAWKRNPHGLFVDWNPRVSCREYTPGAEG
jgi:hypothetical protein